jgi:uncharacterized protein (DUF427 family)
MATATWQGKVIAESDNTHSVEGNTYFPPDSIKSEFFHESDLTTECGWKGTANYYDIVVGQEPNKNAAWYYAAPKPEAANIKGHVAFWKGVTVT